MNLINSLKGSPVKIILIVVGLLLLCCLCSSAIFLYFASIGETTTTNSRDVELSGGNDNVVVEEPASSQIDFNEGLNTGSVWTGAMTVSKGTTQKQMHATYTFKFNFDVDDPSRTVTSVEVTDISAQSSLPNNNVIILPYAHVSRSENGGSVPSTAMFEDWNTYGYVYVTDYASMQSLGDTYQPTLCTEDKYCDYIDEVGVKGGEVALRFKYVGLGSATSDQPSYESINVMKAVGISPSQLSGTFSWKVNVTLDNGTVESKSYSVQIDGDELGLSSSNTSFVDF